MERTPTAPKDLHWDDVRLFLALSRCGTFAGAAGLLGVEPATVSRRLGALEQALTVTLFDRSGDAFLLTRAAEELVPIAERMEHTMTRLANATASNARSRGW